MRALPCLCITWLLASAALAQTDPQAEAQRLYMRGATAFGSERFEEAAEAFEQAYALTHEPALLYNLGRARERAEQIAAAVDAYERFLAEAPADAMERAEVEQSLEALRARLPPPEPEVPEEREEPEVEPEPAPTPPPPPPPSGTATGALPWIVAGAGAATLIAAGVLGGLALATYADADGAPSQQRADELQREAVTLGDAANVCFAVGGGLALLGVVWVLIELATAPSPPPAGAHLRVVPNGIAGAF